MTNSNSEPESGLAWSAPTPPEIGAPEPRGSLSNGLRLQPGIPVTAPKNHLVNAIISVFTCHLFGVFAVYYAMKVDRLWLLGEHERARDTSRKALVWSIVGYVAGAVVIVAVTALNIWVNSRTLHRFGFR